MADPMTTEEMAAKLEARAATAGAMILRASTEDAELMLAAASRIKALDEALKPFADAAADYDDELANPKGYLTDDDELAPMLGITVNHLRAARTARGAT